MLKFGKRQITLYTLALLIIFSAFNVTSHAASISDDGAKTPPPPASQLGILGFFDEDQDYLLDGFNKMSQKSSGKVSITGTTLAYDKVDSIGVTLYLQKWNGSAWKNVDTGGVTYSTAKKDVYTNGTSYTVPTGYYYRLRTVHWVTDDGTYEQGERFSDYLLID